MASKRPIETKEILDTFNHSGEKDAIEKCPLEISKEFSLLKQQIEDGCLLRMKNDVLSLKDHLSKIRKPSPFQVETFFLGKYLFDCSLNFKSSYTFQNTMTSQFFGVIGASGKDVSIFTLTINNVSNIFRIELQLKLESSGTFEVVNHNSSVRLVQVPNPSNIGRRFNKMHEDSNVIHIDQLHILKKYQRLGYGAKLMALIFIWIRKYFVGVRKCVVISPSSIGLPFYFSLGAKQQLSSSNLEFSL